MPKFRKKPVVIEAFRWTGGPDQEQDPAWIVAEILTHNVWFDKTGTPEVVMKIKTLEGVMTAQSGDWIIQGVKGEIYPIKDVIFRETYEPLAGLDQYPTFNTPAEAMRWCEERDASLATDPSDPE